MTAEDHREVTMPELTALVPVVDWTSLPPLPKQLRESHPKQLVTDAAKRL